MTDEEYKIETKVMPYRFWLFVCLSAFLVITFVYYLPLRFQHQAVWREESMRGPADGGAQYHEKSEVREGLAVNLNVTPVPVFTGTSSRLDFFVNQKPGNIPVTDLEIQHTKLMHVIGVRNDMEEFFHIHPAETAISGLLSVDHPFSNPGLYKIWSEIKKDGVGHTFGHPEFAVGGEGERYKKEVFFGKSAIVGNYQVLLHYDEPIVKGRTTDLDFELHDVVGREVLVEPYLAADMHLMVIKDDWKQFIHTHPSEEHQGFLPLVREVSANGADDHREGISAEHGVGFHVVFPEPGVYKAFAQFRPRDIGLPPDEAFTASFWVRVEESKPFTFSNWWINLAVSLVLIALLSFGVKRYLTQE